MIKPGTLIMYNNFLNVISPGVRRRNVMILGEYQIKSTDDHVWEFGTYWKYTEKIQNCLNREMLCCKHEKSCALAVDEVTGRLFVDYGHSGHAFASGIQFHID